MSNQVTGRAYIKVDGKLLRSKEGAKLVSFAGVERTAIIGNQVELYAKEGQIGTLDNPIFIDSDVHGEVGDGGVLAWAQGDIFIREMEGDLYLGQQLDLASGFEEDNPEMGLSNLQSTYDEIRPLIELCRPENFSMSRNGSPPESR